jgi:hypothetical protein
VTHDQILISVKSVTVLWLWEARNVVIMFLMEYVEAL